MMTTGRLGMLLLIILTPLSTTAEPTISIFTNAEEYQPGDILEISLSVENDDLEIAVDVYIVMIQPDGRIWPIFYEGFRPCYRPWIENIFIPAWFEMDRTPFWAFDLPSEAPPISWSGEYQFVAALTSPNTHDYICDPSFAPIVYETGPLTDIVMQSIPAGSFLMGSPDDEEGRFSQEGPQRTVNVSPFQMAETEVTQRQWVTIMGWNESHHRGDDYPVTQVTWFDCLEFCNRLSRSERLTECYELEGVVHFNGHIVLANVSCDFDANGYRLATEAEWEYACRAGTTTRFYWGDSDDEEVMGEYCWYDENAGDSRAVGQKLPNAFGLLDMQGNVSEHCWDRFEKYFYEGRPDPDTDPTGPEEGDNRVVRGGSYHSYPRHCRSAYRGYNCTYRGFSNYGLRVVRSVR
ncbi:MAG: formylglycine-generating enzyme family protein [Candidatus Coatesbacteria bacterium]|nr:formylglycine-generating enzyme family protein [Candidatus Coatesbacteria bacterium]